MTKLIVGTVISIAIVAAWQIGERLSPDDLGLALGVIFGMMAGIPAALIAATAKREDRYQPQRLTEQTTAIVPHKTSYYVVEEQNENNRLRRH